jgi:hypothetical protein
MVIFCDENGWPLSPQPTPEQARVWWGKKKRWDLEDKFLNRKALGEASLIALVFFLTTAGPLWVGTNAKLAEAITFGLWCGPGLILGVIGCLAVRWAYLWIRWGGGDDV